MRRIDAIGRLADFGRALLVSRRELAQSDRSDDKELALLQRRRLDDLIRLAVRRSPFYRDHYRGVDLDRLHLAALPPVTKTQLMARFDDWVTDDRLKLADLERHLERLTRDELYLGRYRVMATSGSTGRRGVFVYDRVAWRRNLANFARLNECYVGVHPRVPRRLRVTAVGATSPVHISARTSLSAGVGINRVLRLDARQPLEELVASLDAFQPEFLVGFPSVLSLLAHEQHEGRLHLRPAKVATVSEVRTPEMTDAIRSAWGVRPFNWYGITEGGVVAGDCQHHQGMHLFEDLFLVENVDGDGMPVADGVVGQKLLLTNLFNRTQPLVRYELSDMVVLDSRPCPCGRASRRVTSIEGRMEDVLHFPKRDGGEVAVQPFMLESPFTHLADVRQYKVVHENDGLRVLLVVRDGARIQATSQRVRDALAAILAEVNAVPPPILVDVVPRLAREQGHGAKFKLIESRRRASGAPSKETRCP
ncbi:MAG: phenylacetate--CoA ligase family protein [Actinomycetota bacterium]|nr:phenylacetate--CoA ligase family protein [Actinomycetota bacterium]